MKRFFPFLLISILIGGSVIAGTTRPDAHEALRLIFLRSADNDPKALYELARVYDTSFDTIAADTAKSTALYLKSARLGYAPAQNFIGFRYYLGEGLTQNIDSAIYWIRQAADSGDITAASNLGYLYLDSPVMSHDTVEAVKWLYIATSGGVKGAEEKLIEIEEENWKELPADSAFKEGAAFYLGMAPHAGVTLLQVAAEKGHPQAMALLGDAFSKERGIPYNHKLATQQFYEAAKKENPSAQFIIAELLDIFPDALDNLAPDIEKSAEYWYEKAKLQGVTDSESAYRLLYSVP